MACAGTLRHSVHCVAGGGRDRQMLGAVKIDSEEKSFSLDSRKTLIPRERGKSNADEVAITSFEPQRSNRQVAALRRGPNALGLRVSGRNC